MWLLHPGLRRRRICGAAALPGSRRATAALGVGGSHLPLQCLREYRGWGGGGRAAAAVPMAAGGERPMEQELAVVGVAVPRLGLAEKVRGQARYTADLKRPGMLYGRVLRSPRAHARIGHLDTAQAECVPGVHAVLTYQDVPQ